MTVTVSLSDETYQKIVLLKNRPDESDEEIINAILDGQIDPEPISHETLNRVEQARKDYKEGKCQTLAEVMTELEDSFE
ncbi:hypothetical protein [Methanospirillum sp.]|uniref:hypothetical protein n=1 Tax=Methanospirillum sp. TaxID=45200 RepID=UPI0029871CDF|nr:hypothetical protein [Methanospirillum sp.]